MQLIINKELNKKNVKLDLKNINPARSNVKKNMQLTDG